PTEQASLAFRGYRSRNGFNSSPWLRSVDPHASRNDLRESGLRCNERPYDENVTDGGKVSEVGSVRADRPRRARAYPRVAQRCQCQRDMLCSVAGRVWPSFYHRGTTSAADQPIPWWRRLDHDLAGLF